MGDWNESGFMYIGRLPCGCAVAGTVEFLDGDNRKFTAESVGEMILNGCAVERVPTDPPAQIGPCRCGSVNAPANT